MSTVTTNKGYVIPGNGENVNTWDTPVRDTINAIDKGLGSTYAISLSSSNVTLTLAQCQNLFFALSGTLTANITIFVQAVGGMWSVDNQTTGAFTVTFKTLAGGSTGVVTPQGARSLIKSNGTNVNFSDDRIVGTVTSVATGTGLTGGTITTSGTVSLANTAVAPAAYGSATQIPTLTVDQQGRITSASNNAVITVPDVTGQSGKYLTNNGTSPNWVSTPTIVAAARFRGPSSGVTIEASQNIASIIRTGTGNYTVTFTFAITTSNYLIVFGAKSISGGIGVAGMKRDVLPSTIGFAIESFNYNSGANNDQDIINFVVYVI